MCPGSRPPGSSALAFSVHILVIGRQRRGPLADLQAFYLGRLVPPPALVELEERRKLPAAQLKAREAELILGALPADARLVALDENGAAWASRDLAAHIAQTRDGARPICFAVGGADGLGAAVIDRADAVVSFGAMTWPHLLARIMLLEQLYRAQQILAGHPYHRD